MSHTDSVIYSNYGAYELKAKYQRNFLLGTLSTWCVLLLGLAVSWIMSSFEEDLPPMEKPIVIRTIKDVAPPPIITKPKLEMEVNQQAVVPKVGIPKPVADDDISDEEDIQLATREEMAVIAAPDISAEESEEMIIDIDEDEFLPAVGEFIAREVEPEMIHYVTPDYPRMAEQAGLGGVVWINALVDKNGDVRDARIAKSSKTPSLDEAALAVAKQNKFRPAIQNGNPIAVWVAYKVEFIPQN